ncbi:carbohydrate-binding module family 50 protein [Xylona heveae TC161]|uniref:Carbohydrate-binding module family 50 protein n=1 Tax=Xylona heveae (strain CBS 132557 / TC161) TaxID=1328760 RepID=A0A165FBH9_XYLHT|nr:carbohydrate-binding module family 50 protein [Xylona heveae TC161]KZF20788.1 carbohydrate-binding module family 50 protein [Xylona heveae TC161]
MNPKLPKALAHILLPWAVLLFFPTQGHDTSFDANLWPGASESCIAALNAPLACHPLLPNLYGGFYNRLSLRTLQGICTDQCFASLQEHQQNVSLSCGSTKYYDEPANTYYPAAIFDIQSLHAFNQTCLRSNGEFCETYFQNNTNQNLCNDCYLQSLQFQLNYALHGQDEDLASSFGSLTSQCSSTKFPTTSPTPIGSSISAAVPKPTCTGFIYQLQPSDTMYSVSEAQRVSTDTLLNRNALANDESSFPTEGSLCIEDQCDVHVVRVGETCRSITHNAGISRAQLLSWNANIHPKCTNIKMLVNQTLCISNPYGNYTIEPNRERHSHKTRTRKFQPPPISPVPFREIPYSEFLKYIPTPTMTFEAQGEGSRCSGVGYGWLLAKQNGTCDHLLADSGLSFEHFYELNPSVGNDCSGVVAGTRYCITYLNNGPSTMPADLYGTASATTNFLLPTVNNSQTILNSTYQPITLNGRHAHHNRHHSRHRRTI